MSNQVPPYPQGALLQAPLAGESVHEFSGLVVFCEAGVDMQLGQLVERHPDETSVVRPLALDPAPRGYVGICIGTREWDLNNYWAAPEAGQICVIAVPTCMAYVLLGEDLAAGTVLTPSTQTAGAVQAWATDASYAGILEEGGLAGERALAYMRPLDPVSIPPGPSGQYGWGLDTLAFITPQWFYQTVNNFVGGGVDSYKGIFSVWFKTHQTAFHNVEWMMQSDDSVGVNIFSTLGQNSGAPVVRLRRAGPTTLLNVTTTTQATQNVWHHFMCSWDISAGKTFADDFHCYLDDVSVKPGSATTFTTGSKVSWGEGLGSNFRIGIGDTSITVPSVQMSGYYLNTQEYLDLSVENNRRKFISASGLPQPMGLTGERPTGNQPAMYFDNPVASLIQNRGYLGPFVLGNNVVLGDVPGPNP